MIGRRDFMKASALVSAGSLLGQGQLLAVGTRIQRITVRNLTANSPRSRLATRELLSGLRTLRIACEVVESNDVTTAYTLTLAIDPTRFRGAEDYEISRTSKGASLHAPNDQALLYAVFEFLERQGMVFGIDGSTAPIDRVQSLILPENGQPWNATPRFGVRGLLPWPDFLNCISIYNIEDFKAYFANMLRMRLNMFAMHVYTQNEPGPLAESYLSFDFAGSSHRATLEDTTSTSWGYLPERTSNYKMGAAQFFDTDTFGSDASRLSADTWEIARRTTEMLRAGFNFAADLGIRTGIGFEPYQNPAEIVRALPPEALSFPGGFVESRTARDLLERRLADLLERYPMVNDVWLWQDEHANWESRRTNVPLSTTPFVQAHEFLKRHAPDKHLVLAGWGGVTRHFASLHSRLPEDIVFSALSDTLGWDPLNEAFGKLGVRERWPVPWLEDDPAMWLPQFRASRFESDMKRAENFGCQGMLGIHWRHRIVDPTATYFSRAAWDRNLTASSHYRKFCATQASQERIEKLSSLLDACDTKRAIASTFLGDYDKNGFANKVELAGDYNEAFNYATEIPGQAILSSQRTLFTQFDQLASDAMSPLEKNRIGYFAGFLGLTVHYCNALDIAHRLDAVLKHAVELRAAKQPDEARKLVAEDGVPLWLALAPQVRASMLEFQHVIATRNDQGQLASMQNKFVRIALERLRLSLQEFIGDLTPEIQSAYATAISPDTDSRPRIFLPTRPSILKAGDSLRLFIVAPGVTPPHHNQPAIVKLLTRPQGVAQWNSIPATLAGRNVYFAQLGPFTTSDNIVEYHAAATAGFVLLTDPPDSPTNTYFVNILD